MMTSDPGAAARSGAGRAGTVSCLAWIAGCLVLAVGELLRVSPPNGNPAGLWQRILVADPDALVYLLFLAAGPFVWWTARRGTAAGVPGGPSGANRGWRAWIGSVGRSQRGSIGRAIALSCLVAAASLANSAWVGRHFDHLPPAYHDEYSYLFQAKTFLAGRLSFPCHEAAPLFDQMHVLNEGRFASRYFPGAGAWLAPFVAMGDPWWGQWLAGALCAVLIFWCGRELAGDCAGLLAGLLTAFAPGMALFSNLLLAHHPTLVGLSLFLFGYFRMLRDPRPGWALVAGAGLGFAALCRPMTAFGVSLPLALHSLWWWLAPARRPSFLATTDQSPPSLRLRSFRSRTILALSLAAPLVVCGAIMFAYDAAITGSGWKTPYSVYTELYTPRHVYGFNNVERGERRLGPKVIEKYDAWAENLTPELAARNVWQRLLASGEWTLGLIPLAMALVAGVAFWSRLNSGTRLVLAAIASLHLVHIPYWFMGMQNYHYVFETGPLWLLWLSAVTATLFANWRTRQGEALAAWWLGLVAAAVALNYAVSGGLWSAPLDKGIAEVLFPRAKYARFALRIADEVLPLPALVLVEDDPADRHIDYVVNEPDLSAEVLFGRWLPERIPLAEVRRLFPGRTVFLYRARDESLQRLSGL